MKAVEKKDMFINTRWVQDNRAISVVLILLFIGCYTLSYRLIKDFFSVSRTVSKLTGIFCNTTLPPYFRAALYKAFGTMYNVKFHEARVANLNDFTSFNAFFTRKIKPECRPISDVNNPNSLVSPCDGTVLSLGEVNAKDSTLECIKGNNYRLDEFLFGCQSDQGFAVCDKKLKDAKARGNKVMYLVIYLSPGDYHRFHSPANFVTNHRRHVAGYLEPVDPRYLKTHTDVFKSNERVNLMGKWTHGFFAYCMVGATNVGSIKVNFDESLKTNSYEVTTCRDRVYTEDQPDSPNLTQDGITLEKGEEIGFF